MEQFLTIWDWGIIALYLSAVVALGLLFARRQTSLEEYFLARKNIPWWVVSISTYATEMSAISFLGTAGWIFRKDSRAIIVPALLLLFVMPLSALVWVPIWSRLRMLSIYEYLERRYHQAVRTFAATIFPIQTIFWIGNALLATAMAVNVATGFDVTVILVTMIALGTLYTVAGGARAVIWTDLLQFAVFMVGYLVILGLLLHEYDWRPWRIYEVASSVISEETKYPHTKILSLEFSLAMEATVWNLLLNQILSVISYGSNQLAMQRLMAADTRRSMFKAVLGQGGVTILVVSVTTFTAWGFVAFYHDNPAAREGMTHDDQVLAHYMINFVPPYLFRAVMLAALLASMMSTFDSALNSMASVSINDFYRRYFARDRSAPHYLKVSRHVTLGWGVLILLFALWQSGHAESVVSQRVPQLLALTAAPFPIFFALGIFAKRVNTVGALTGGVISVVFALVFNGFPGLFEPLVKGINWMWIASLATIVGIVVGYLTSLLFPAPSREALRGLTLFQGGSDR